MLWLIAVRNLLQHRRRSILLGSVVAFVSALLLVMLGLFTGMEDTMLESATTLMTGHVNVGGFYKPTPGQAAPIVTDVAKVVEIVKREVPELDYVTLRGRGWAKLISEASSMQVGVGAINIDTEPGFRRVMKVTSGSLDDLRKPNTLLLFEGQAKKLDVKVGDALTLSSPTPSGTSNTLDLTVAAIAADVGMISSWNVYVPDQALKVLYQLKADTTGAVFLYLKDLSKVKDVQARLRDVFEREKYTVMDNDPQAFFMKFEKVTREDWTKQRLDITTWEDEISFMSWTLKAVGGLTFILVGMALFIIAVGLMCSMWIAIRERTREIGTLRAVGMKRGGVLRMFVVEGFTLAVSATILGALLGIALCAGLNALHVHVPPEAQLFVMRDTLYFEVNPLSVLYGIAVITGCTSLVSLIPAFVAARLKPITAMQHAG
ncbi:MAG: ABC transporter permease [Myxococcaceae bacterium]